VPDLDDLAALGKQAAEGGHDPAVSWLGREHHGRGYGTEMRAAVLDGSACRCPASPAVETSAMRWVPDTAVGTRPDGRVPTFAGRRTATNRNRARGSLPHAPDRMSDLTIVRRKPGVAHRLCVS
jgi:hypothetical protein